MGKKWLVALLGAGAMTLSTGALAQQSYTAVPGFYIGAEVGQTSFEGDGDDEDDTGFKILGGYQFHRHFGAELGYGLLFDKEGVEVTAFELVATGRYPFTPQFSLVGKLGFAMWESEAGAFDDDGTDLTWAIGVQYDFNRNVGARVMWQGYDLDDADADFLNIGIVWRF
jgi:OOP family OmpA-OmpF porin